MKRFAKIAAAVAVLLAASGAYATGTWADVATGSKSVTASYTTGTETLPQPVAATPAWDGATTYAAGTAVIYQGAPYVSLQSSNTNHNPAVAASTWWRIVGVDVYRAATLEIAVCAFTRATAYVSDGDGFDVYLWDPAIGVWSKFNITPYKVPNGSAGNPCSGPLQGDVPVIAIPLVFNGQGIRMAVVPTAAATSDLDASHPMVIWHRVMGVNKDML